MELYYTINQASNCLGCNRGTVEEWIHKNKIEAVKDGKFYKINSKEVHKMSALMKHYRLRD